MSTDYIGSFRPSSPIDKEKGSRRGDVVGGYNVNRSGYDIPAPTDSPGGGQSYYGDLRAMRTNSGGRFVPYRDRDMTRILNRVASQGAIFDLQLSLVQAGFLDDEVGFGYIDGDTEDAFSTVLSLANQHGVAWQDLLSQAAAAGGTFGGGGMADDGSGGRRELAPTVIQLPNRDDSIRRAADIGMELGGVQLDDDLTESVADSMIEALATHQERQIQREMAAGEGDVLFTDSAPDPDRLLEEQIRERAPGVIAEKGARDVADLWFQAMGGPV